MKPFDIFIVSAPKDYNKIEYCLSSIVRNIEGFQNIYLCTPSELPQEKKDSLHFPIHYRTDKKVLLASPHLWRYRPNWIYQQFIKLFQNETENDWYYVLDVDTIINKPLSLFEGKKPVWCISWEQNNKPYYDFNEAFFGYGRVYNHSFLADMGFYSKKVVRQMLLDHKYTVKSFLEKSYRTVTKEIYPSEADIYMSYVMTSHPDLYSIKQIHNDCKAREGRNPIEHLWSKKDIEKHIEEKSHLDVDTIAIHSWVDVSHNEWR